MSNIPPADFSQIIPQGPSDAGETNLDPANAREPLPHQPLVTQLPSYDPSKNLADQIAQVLGEGPVQHNEQIITTGTEFPSQTPPAPTAPQPPPVETQPQQTTQPAAPVPPPQSPVQGEGEGGSDAVSGSSAAPPDLPSEDESTFSLDNLAQQLYGRPVTPEEATAIMQLWRDASALTPAQKHQVAVAMGYVEDDTPPPPSHQAAVQPPPQPAQPQFHQNEDDPYLAPHIAPLRNELGQLRDQVQHLVSDRQLSEQQQLERQANEALNSFRDSHAELTEEEHTALRLRARDRGVLAATYQRTGDLTSAINDALEYEMWQDPNLRAKIHQVQQEQQRVNETIETQRQQRAASLGPGGSQVPRESDDTPQPPRVMDRHEARKAMAADLAPYFNQQP